MPTVEELYRISRAIEDNHIDALMMIGGWNGYQAAELLHRERDRFPACGLPMTVGQTNGHGTCVGLVEAFATPKRRKAGR